MRKTIGLLLSVTALWAQEGATVVAKGSFLYSKPLLLGVKGDGSKTKVAMQAEIIVKKGEKGYEGYLTRGYYDFETKKMVPYIAKTVEGKKITAIKKIPFVKIEKINNKTLHCVAKNGLEYTFVDGGEGYLNDKVTVKVHQVKKNLSLYGGDIVIGL